MAVIAAFFPLTSVMAQEFTQEQIDAIVAKAVDKALADRQALEILTHQHLARDRHVEAVGLRDLLATADGMDEEVTGREGERILSGEQADFDVRQTYRGQMTDWLAALAEPEHHLVSPLSDALETAELMLAMKAAA